MAKYEISKRDTHKRLAHIERLKMTKAATQDMAQRWYNAFQATALPGSGGAAFGFITTIVRQDDAGQQCLVRWHNGTYTSVWFGDSCLDTGTPVVVKTLWNDDEEGVWVKDRPMRVTEVVDVMPPDVEQLYEEYWRCARELDDLDMQDLMMIAPIEDEKLPPSPVPASRSVSRGGVMRKAKEHWARVITTSDDRPAADAQPRGGGGAG